MGIQILIAEACTIPGAETSTHADIGQKVELDSKDDALVLCRMGRALYLDKTQDPTKGSLTAAKEDVDRIKKHAAQIAAAQEERAAQATAAAPGGIAALVAAQVAAAMAALQAKPAA